MTDERTDGQKVS